MGARNVCRSTSPSSTAAFERSVISIRICHHSSIDLSASSMSQPPPNSASNAWAGPWQNWQKRFPRRQNKKTGAHHHTAQPAFFTNPTLVSFCILQNQKSFGISFAFHSKLPPRGRKSCAPVSSTHLCVSMPTRDIARPVKRSSGPSRARAHTHPTKNKAGVST